MERDIEESGLLQIAAMSVNPALTTVKLASNAIQVTVCIPIGIHHPNQLINIDFFDIAIIITQRIDINVGVYIWIPNITRRTYY